LGGRLGRGGGGRAAIETRLGEGSVVEQGELSRQSGRIRCTQRRRLLGHHPEQPRAGLAGDFDSRARGKLLAMFDVLVTTVTQPQFRGCAFADASAESGPDMPGFGHSDQPPELIAPDSSGAFLICQEGYQSSLAAAQYYNQ
jgi:hypothetical protein